MKDNSYITELGEQKNEYSPKLAQMFGLNVAVYAELLLTIYSKAAKKGKLDPEGFVELDRGYIKLQTTLDDETQVQCDAILQNVGIVERNFLDVNSVKVDKNVYVGILYGTDIGVVEDLMKKSKVKREQTSADKRALQSYGVKKTVVESNPDVKKAIDALVDSSYSGTGKNRIPFTKQMLEVFLNTLRQYTQDPDAQIAIINIALASGYTQVAWAIQQFERDYVRTGLYKQINEQTSTGLNNKNVFQLLYNNYVRTDIPSSTVLTSVSFLQTDKSNK